MERHFYEEYLDVKLISKVNCEKIKKAKKYADIVKNDCLINAYFDGYCNDSKCKDYINARNLKKYF